MRWDDWKNMKAADRLELLDQVSNAFNLEDEKPNLFPVIHDFPLHLNLLRELAFGDSVFCDCCEESVPEIMCYDGVECDEDWKDGIEADIVQDYEWRICASCVQSKREETVCENCGMERWQITRGHRDALGRYYQTAVPCVRRVGQETVEFPEHSMKLKHPYKGASA
jgi:hypothetical protein